MSVIEKAATYEAPGREGSPVELKPLATRTSSAATGSRRSKGEYVGEPDAGDRRAVHRGAALDSGGHRARARRRARGEGRLGRDLDDRAVEGPEQGRGCDRGQPGDARGRRELGERQAGAGDARRGHPARGRPLPLLRLGDPGRGGCDLRDRQGHGRLPLQGAARSRRADHPVQLPAADGGVEAGAGARGGQLLGAQAGEPDPVVDPQADGAARGDRPAGRDQRRQRAGWRDRQGARDEQADRQDRLHRRDRDRAADHAVRGPEHHPLDDRARRQVAEHLLRRRDGGGRRLPRQGGRGPRALRLQQGRGLHLPLAGADRGVDLRAVHGAGARSGSRAIRQGHPLDLDDADRARRSRPHSSRRSRATSRSASRRAPSC